MVSSWDESDEKTQVFDNERVEGVPSGAERWYISPDGKTKEVLTAAEIIERARSGALSDSTLVWRDGLSDWSRLDAVPELMQAMIAFRSSSAATIVRDASARESAPSIAGNNRSALPLPPLPGVPATGNRISTSGPLPPPPSLPPIPNLPGGAARSGASSEPQEANTVAIASPVLRPREPQPTLSSVASQAGQLVANSSRNALGRVSVWANKALAIVDRDVTVPEIGVVRGRLLAQVGLGIVALIGLLIVITRGGDPTESTVVATHSSVVASGEQRGDGLDLDEDNAQKPAQASEEAVSLGELEPVGARPKHASESAGGRGGSNAAASKPNKKGKEFDVLAAKSALSVAAEKAATCKQGPKGEGSVRVKIAPSGKVVSAALTTPAFQGTAAGNCVLQVFRQATVPAFVGEDKTVFKKFAIN